jgi:hypothetical protein
VWAEGHVEWTAAHWDSVIFSQESKFNRHGSDGKQQYSTAAMQSISLTALGKHLNFQQVK